ncbi:MAG: amidase domain-containing protein [Acidimicrobiales bacterium]
MSQSPRNRASWFAKGAAAVVVALGALLILPGTAFAYNGGAAAQYADAYTQTPNPQYTYFNGDDCTNFISQAFRAGGFSMVNSPLNTYNPSPGDDHNWWDLTGAEQYTVYPQPATSHSAAVAQDLNTFLVVDNPGGISEGYFYYNNGNNRAPAYTPNAMVTGDVLFYDWTDDGDIDHASMQVGIGTDQYGFYGNVVDSHTNPRYHVFWTLKPVNTQWKTTVVYFQHVAATNP